MGRSQDQLDHPIQIKPLPPILEIEHSGSVAQYESKAVGDHAWVNSWKWGKHETAFLQIDPDHNYFISLPTRLASESDLDRRMSPSYSPFTHDQIGAGKWSKGMYLSMACVEPVFVNSNDPECRRSPWRGM